jgi:hypothetical protein
MKSATQNDTLFNIENSIDEDAAFVELTTLKKKTYEY